MRSWLTKRCWHESWRRRTNSRVYLICIMRYSCAGPMNTDPKSLLSYWHSWFRAPSIRIFRRTGSRPRKQGSWGSSKFTIIWSKGAPPLLSWECTARTGSASPHWPLWAYSWGQSQTRCLWSWCWGSCREWSPKSVRNVYCCLSWARPHRRNTATKSTPHLRPSHCPQTQTSLSLKRWTFCRRCNPDWTWLFYSP